MRGGELAITPTRLLGVLIVFLGTMALGGFVAYLIGGATSPRHALFYGLGWQGLIGGAIQGGRAEIAEAKTRESN